jgi:hypothetical protein
MEDGSCTYLIFLRINVAIARKLGHWRTALISALLCATAGYLAVGPSGHAVHFSEQAQAVMQVTFSGRPN